MCSNVISESSGEAMGDESELPPNVPEDSGAIENLFDQYYYRHLDWGNIPRAGRNLYLNLAWHF